MSHTAIARPAVPRGETLNHFDHELRGLDIALDPSRLAALVDEALGPGAGATRIVGVELLKHRPGRRCSLAVEVVRGGRRSRLFLKVFHRDRALRIRRATRDIAEALESTSTTRVPRPLHALRSPSLLLTEFVDGAALAPFLYRLRPAETARRIADSLCDLHGTAVRLPRRWSVADELSNTRRWLDEVPPQLARRAGLLADELAANAPADVEPAPIHRDFYPEQLLSSGRLCFLLDLDDARMGDPAVDAGNFLAHLRLRAFEEPGRRSGCARAARAFRGRFLERGKEDATRAERVGFFEGASLLRLVGVYAARHPEDRRLPLALLNVAVDRVRAVDSTARV